MQGGHPPLEYEDLTLMREANLKPWELDDPRFTLRMRMRILGAISGEKKAERISKLDAAGG